MSDDEDFQAAENWYVARIAELEAEVTRLNNFIEWQAPIVKAKVRPDDQAIIDGQKWRLTNPLVKRLKHPNKAGATHHLTANVVPVDEDSDECNDD